MTDLTDQQLLIKMHGGNHAAAEMLWKRLSPRLYVHARSLAREGSLGEDCVQGAFLRVLGLPKREVQLIKDPLPWLMMVVRREVFQALRARGRATRRERRYGADDHSAREHGSHGTGNEHSLAISPELREQLEAALESLPRREREVIMLRHYVMLTFDQMELALGIARSTVVSRYRAAIARLEALMTMNHDNQHSILNQHARKYPTKSELAEESEHVSVEAQRART